MKSEGRHETKALSRRLPLRKKNMYKKSVPLGYAHFFNYPLFSQNHFSHPPPQRFEKRKIGYPRDFFETILRRDSRGKIGRRCRFDSTR